MAFWSRRGCLALPLAILAAAPALAQEPIRIGVLAALTGPLAGAAPQVTRGMQLAAEDINAKGGVNGRKIVLVLRDTGGDPTKAVSLAQQIIFRENVHYVVGPLGSQEAAAGVPVIAQAGLPNFLMGTVEQLIDPETRPLAIRFNVTNDQLIEASREYMTKVLKRSKVAVFADSTGYGVFAAKQVDSVLDRYGEKSVLTLTIDPNKIDLTDEVNRAKAAGADVIFAWTGATGLLGRLINVVQDGSWKVPIVGHPNITAHQVRDLLHKPEYWNSVYSVNMAKLTYDAKGELPEETREMIKVVRPKLGGGKIDFALPYFAIGYDMVRFVEHVVGTTGSTSVEAYRKVLDTPATFKGASADVLLGPGIRNLFKANAMVPVVASSLDDGVMRPAPATAD